MSDDEEFLRSKLTDIEYEKGEEESGSITYRSFISFSYKGFDYHFGVDVTFSWGEDGEDYDFNFLDDEPEELYDVWDEIREVIEEHIKAEDKKSK